MGYLIRIPTRHLPPGAATCHPKFCYPTFAPLHAAQPHLHLCTVSLPPHVPMPPCQHVPSRLRRALVNVSTCQPVPSRKRCPLATFGRARFSDPMVRPDPCSAPADYLNNSMPRFPMAKRKIVLNKKVTGRTRMINPRKPPIAEPAPDIPPFPYPIRHAIKVPPRT